MGRRRQKERKRRDKRQKRRAARGARQERQADRGEVDLRVQHPDLARPPVYVDSAGGRLSDPYTCLGLVPEPPPTPEAVRAAFRTAIAATPPEADPQRARELVEARNFLLEPREVLARTLGDLRVPDPRHFVPGYESRVIPSASPQEPAPAVRTVEWSSRSRLVALMTLYALLEAELEGGATSAGAQQGLGFD